MKIVYFGTDVFLNVFHYLRENHEIVALYTYHQDEDYFTERNIVEEAEQADIPVHYKSIDAQTIMDFIEKDGVELFLMAEYNRIIPVPDRKVFRRRIFTVRCCRKEGVTIRLKRQWKPAAMSPVLRCIRQKTVWIMVRL